MVAEWLMGYAIRTKAGTVRITATVTKFRDHLNHYIYLAETGQLAERFWENEMSSVEWSRYLIAGNDGRYVLAKGLDLFEKDLKEVIAEEEQRARFEAEREEKTKAAMHKVFDSAKRDKLPKERVIQYTVMTLGFGIDTDPERLQAEEAKVRLFIDESEDFGTMFGPSGGLVRCVNAQGKETQTYLDNRESINFGKITRTRKNKNALPAAPESGEFEEASQVPLLSEVESPQPPAVRALNVGKKK